MVETILLYTFTAVMLFGVFFVKIKYGQFFFFQLFALVFVISSLMLIAFFIDRTPLDKKQEMFPFFVLHYYLDWPNPTKLEALYYNIGYFVVSAMGIWVEWPKVKKREKELEKLRRS